MTYLATTVLFFADHLSEDGRKRPKLRRIHVRTVLCVCVWLHEHNFKCSIYFGIVYCSKVSFKQSGVNIHVIVSLVSFKQSDVNIHVIVSLRGLHHAAQPQPYLLT